MSMVDRHPPGGLRHGGVHQLPAGLRYPRGIHGPGCPPKVKCLNSRGFARGRLEAPDFRVASQKSGPDRWRNMPRQARQHTFRRRKGTGKQRGLAAWTLAGPRKPAPRYPRSGSASVRPSARLPSISPWIASAGRSVSPSGVSQKSVSRERRTLTGSLSRLRHHAISSQRFFGTRLPFSSPDDYRDAILPAPVRGGAADAELPADRLPRLSVRPKPEQACALGGLEPAQPEQRHPRPA